jgi:hypothetical protein
MADAHHRVLERDTRLYRTPEEMYSNARRVIGCAGHWGRPQLVKVKYFQEPYVVEFTVSPEELLM